MMKNFRRETSPTPILLRVKALKRQEDKEASF